MLSLASDKTAIINSVKPNPDAVPRKTEADVHAKSMHLDVLNKRIQDLDQAFLVDSPSVENWDKDIARQQTLNSSQEISIVDLKTRLAEEEDYLVEGKKMESDLEAKKDKTLKAEAESYTREKQILVKAQATAFSDLKKAENSFIAEKSIAEKRKSAAIPKASKVAESPVAKAASYKKSRYLDPNSDDEISESPM